MNRTPLDITCCRAVLDEQQPQFDRFRDLLLEANQTVNLTRITDPRQVRIRHFLDSLAALPILDELAAALPNPLRLLDAGSGAGFPGLVLAAARPGWSVVSLEATEKKLRFQRTVCDALNLDNVRLLHGRAEDVAHQPGLRHNFDAVTARALAALPVLAELTLGLVRPNGLALYWKSADSADECKQAENAVRQMGARTDRVAVYTLADETEGPIDFSLVVCRKVKPTPKQYPRPFGAIKKQPLTEPGKK